MTIFGSPAQCHWGQGRARAKGAATGALVPRSQSLSPYPALGVLITNLKAARHLANAKSSNTKRHTLVRNAVADDITPLITFWR